MENPNNDRPLDGTPAERIEAVRQVAEAALTSPEDVRRLVRLTADYLYLLGQRIPPEGRIPAGDPVKAFAVFRELDAHLGKMEARLGLAQPGTERISSWPALPE